MKPDYNLSTVVHMAYCSEIDQFCLNYDILGLEVPPFLLAKDVKISGEFLDVRFIKIFELSVFILTKVGAYECSSQDVA